MLKAIDLYCGVGGWALGLKLSGMRVLEGIDISSTAIETYSENLGGTVRRADIRSLDLDSLPSVVDVIVGSPPCTQFSYANRGGSGNLSDGIQDLRAFLAVVRHIKPEYWIMENVPRVEKIIDSESRQGGELAEFSDLLKTKLTLDFSEFGLPQRRRRCLVGHFPLDLLLEYRKTTPTRTLHEMISAFEEGYYYDVMYGTKITNEELTDHAFEQPLSNEEVRLNIEAKSNHPVYNRMGFPDDLNRPSRTVTATCTRVSRESIVIPDSRAEGDFRRLTIRERASLQGFPGKFGFFAPSPSAKIRMIGNALPPLIAYYVGCALRGVSASRLRHPWQRKQLSLAQRQPSSTTPKTTVFRYAKTRRFRAVLPGFRFKSGMRFELSNSFDGESPMWCVDFKYGTPTDIRGVNLRAFTHSLLLEDSISLQVYNKLTHLGWQMQQNLSRSNPHIALQQVWVHRRQGLGPFEVVDELGRLGKIAEKELSDVSDELMWERLKFLMKQSLEDNEILINEAKLRDKRRQIYAGMIVGCWFNNFLMLG